MNPLERTVVHLSSLAAIAGIASAQTVTVTIGSDTIDVDPQTATIADLPGPDGEISLSEALIATNNTPGHQTIGFAIPQSEWTLQFLYPGRAVLQTSVGFYWRAYDEVTIDGTTQTSFTGDTHSGGAEVVLHGSELYLNAPGCTLRGIDSSSIAVTGSFGLVEDNTSVNVDLFSGSGTVVRGNTGGTIKIDRSNDNVVVGNTVQRVRVLGFGTSQPAANNRVGGPGAADRNFLLGYGTWNSEGLPAGAAVQLVWTQGTVIENNWIGTTTDGLAQGNLACTMGINLQTDNHDVTVRDNLIAGVLGHGMGPHHAGQLFGWAIYFWGSTTNIQIVGNTIGLDANGAPLLGSVWGVNVDNFSGYSVDGVSLVDNEIAGHILDGVRVGPTATMRVSGNAIHSNGWLGIDLIPDNFASGVSPNDVLDADTGGNGVQNFPVLTAAVPEGPSLRVLGELDSSPSQSFTIELFASSTCDDSGFGEGELFLWATSVTTDALGHASFDTVVPTAPPSGWWVTATSIQEPSGATSEFSECLPVSGPVGTIYCTALPNSTGFASTIAGFGSASILANDLVLAADNLPAQPGIFIAGPSAAQLSFFNGFLCIDPNGLQRFVAVTTPAGGTAIEQVDLGSSAAGGLNVSAGSSYYFQRWYRDPAAGGGNANFSNGVEIQYVP